MKRQIYMVILAIAIILLDPIILFVGGLCFEGLSTSFYTYREDIKTNEGYMFHISFNKLKF